MHPYESPLTRRLNAAMEQQGINARELAAQAGVGASFVYDILKGKSRNPTLQKLDAVARVLGISSLWLAKGEEEAQRAGMGSALVFIPALAVEVTSAGLMVVTPQNSGGGWRFHRAWLQEELRKKPEELRVVEVQDNAMAPEISPGDKVLVDIGDTDAREGHVYVILDRIGLTLRKVRQLPEGLEILAVNGAFPPFMAEKGEVTVIGRVVWASRKV